MSKNLLEEFNIKSKSGFYNVTDYSAFENKKLVDEFRMKILEDLSDKGFIGENISADLINQEIDDITEGYDLSNLQRNYLYNLIDGEVNGYGPLTELLKDPNISEIMVNSPCEIYIEIDGKLQKDETVSFINDAHIIRTIERLIEPAGKTISINTPMVDARLDNGSRINAVIPPLSQNPVITIRKFKKNIVNMDTLVGNGSLTPYMARFLEASVKAKLNILVSGAAGSGKTTMLNILGDFISEDERIITIEDVLELNLNKEHVVRLETKMPNYDGMGEVTVRDLVKNAMRMRPDHIIIGEVRGAEAFDLLQAMNTGHDGSLTTLHANSAKDALSRLETMVLMDGLKVPLLATRNYIANAIDIVVHMTRMKDGKRKVTTISEIVGVENDELIVNEIFEFKNDATDNNDNVHGEYILHPGKPKALTKMHNVGINDVDDIFKKVKKS